MNAINVVNKKRKIISGIIWLCTNVTNVEIRLLGHHFSFSLLVCCSSSTWAKACFRLASPSNGQYPVMSFSAFIKIRKYPPPETGISHVGDYINDLAEQRVCVRTPCNAFLSGHGEYILFLFKVFVGCNEPPNMSTRALNCICVITFRDTNVTEWFT